VAWPLLLYGGLALLFWGPWVLDDPNGTLLAENDLDPSAYLWFFSWWPHAVLNGLDPFYTEVIFVPDGYNLAWVTSMPGPSLLLAPLTLALGPVVTFNFLAFAAPAVGAWTAFLLCRHLTGNVPASVLGGYLFGFSPYVLYQLWGGAPQLAFIALVPVVVLLTVRHLEGSISHRGFGVGMTAVLTAQIYTSTEVFATTVVFGAITLLAAYLVSSEHRTAILRTARVLAAALGATVVLAGPLLFHVFFRSRTLPEQAIIDFPADLLSFLVPGHLIAAAPERIGAIQPSWATGAAYLGLPLLALLAAFAWGYRRERTAQVALIGLLIPTVAALGPALHVAGEDTGIPMPWVAFDSLPLLRFAIPLRFPAFVFLGAGIIVAMWLARRPSRGRWAIALVAAACLLPAVGSSEWHTRVSEVAFFAGERHDKLLDENDRVLTVPTWGHNGYWQAQTGFAFKMAAGYVGAFPATYERYATWRDLFGSAFGNDVPPPRGLRRFLRDKGVTTIVVELDRAPIGRDIFRRLGVRPVATGGVLFHRLRPAPR
jgi:hypothetical protein